MKAYRVDSTVKVPRSTALRVGSVGKFDYYLCATDVKFDYGRQIDQLPNELLLDEWEELVIDEYGNRMTCVRRGRSIERGLLAAISVGNIPVCIMDDTEVVPTNAIRIAETEPAKFGFAAVRPEQTIVAARTVPTETKFGRLKAAFVAFWAEIKNIVRNR